MKIKEIIFLPSIIDKLLWKHYLSEKEIREALRNKPKFRRVERGKVDGEDLYSALCKTNQGRYLIIFFVHKQTHFVLFISTVKMNDRLSRKYEKK